MVTKTAAVVDRVSEGTYAVIIAEDINEQFIVNIHDINIQLYEGLWLDLYITDEGDIDRIEINEAATKKQQTKARQLMDQLRKRQRRKK